MKKCPACHAIYPMDYTHGPRDLAPVWNLDLWADGAVVGGALPDFCVDWQGRHMRSFPSRRWHTPYHHEIPGRHILAGCFQKES